MDFSGAVSGAMTGMTIASATAAPLTLASSYMVTAAMVGSLTLSFIAHDQLGSSNFLKGFTLSALTTALPLTISNQLGWTSKSVSKIQLMTRDVLAIPGESALSVATPFALNAKYPRIKNTALGRFGLAGTPIAVQEGLYSLRNSTFSYMNSTPIDQKWTGYCTMALGGTFLFSTP